MTTGRTDWETITTFYPMLKEPEPGLALEGPSNLPLGVTNVTFINPNESRSTLRSRNFEVRRITTDDDGNPISERWRLPAAQANRQVKSRPESAGGSFLSHILSEEETEWLISRA